MQIESQYIASQDTILDEMQALLGEARKIDWDLADYLNERDDRKRLGIPYYSDDFGHLSDEQLTAEIRKLQAAQDLRLVAYTKAQMRMLNGMIEFVKSGIPATAELVSKFSTNRLHS